MAFYGNDPFADPLASKLVKDRHRAEIENAIAKSKVIWTSQTPPKERWRAEINDALTYRNKPMGDWLKQYERDRRRRRFWGRIVLNITVRLVILIVLLILGFGR